MAITNQGENAIAIGNMSSQTTQGSNSIAMGFMSGNNQQTRSISIGSQSGFGQGTGAIAIGHRSGYTGQRDYAIAIGNYAGNAVSSQGSFSIAIGHNASTPSNNSIFLNASGGPITTSGTGFFVNPIRSDTTQSASSPFNVLYYNTSTSEIAYSTSGNTRAFNLFLTGAAAGAASGTGGISNANNTNNNIFCNNVYALNEIYSNSVYTTKLIMTSDYRIKENVKPLDNKFHVDYLKPVSYTNKQTNEEDIGFIAHELQEHYPELVTGVKDGPELQRINYIGLIPILVTEIKALKNNNIMLENEINNIKEFLKKFT